MKKLGLLMMVVVLSGCDEPVRRQTVTRQKVSVWYKDGVETDEVINAKARCENDSYKAKPETNYILNQLISSCMRAEGFRTKYEYR